MTTSTCRHGLAPDSCQICRVLDGGAGVPERTGRRAPEARERRGGGVGLGLTVIGVIAVLVALSWVVAVVWAVLRIVELVAVAFVFGWVGWKLGVRHGRRTSR